MLRNQVCMSVLAEKQIARAETHCGIWGEERGLKAKKEGSGPQLQLELLPSLPN